MRKIGLVAAATLSLLVLTGAPAAYSDDLPDVPIGAGVPSVVTDTTEAGASSECVQKSTYGSTERDYRHSSICVHHESNNKVWGSLSFFAPGYSAGTEVFFDLYVYRCRQSDNVCVVISSSTGSGYTDSNRYFFTGTDLTTQTWGGRYYKACGALSTATGWGYGRTCTPRLIP